jgi:aromatic ring-opening dioxygenase LigB subunit
LPLPLLVGAWLTGGIRRSFVAVEPTLEAEECAALGADLADAAERVVLLVMGDGSARHDDKAPGYVDGHAPAYDAAVSAALASADVDALLDLDPVESERLLVAGCAPWQVLAGAAVGRDWTVQDHAFSAPYGVGYHVASWT